MNKGPLGPLFFLTFFLKLSFEIHFSLFECEVLLSYKSYSNEKRKIKKSKKNVCLIRAVGLMV